MPNSTSTNFGFVFEAHSAGQEQAANVSDDALQSVFKEIQRHGLTLRTFLLAIFSSKGSYVKARVGMFYVKGGPGAMIDCWMQKLQRTSNDKTFMEAAAKTVAD